MALWDCLYDIHSTDKMTEGDRACPPAPPLSVGDSDVPVPGLSHLGEPQRRG